MNAFPVNPHRYVLDGAIEAGNHIPLSGFLNSTASEDDVVTAFTGIPLDWNAGVETRMGVLRFSHSHATGGSGQDSIEGGLAGDTLKGDNGRDNILGGDGNDSALGGGQNYVSAGGLGQDKLFGNIGADAVWGDAGNDTLYGGAGNETLIGGTEVDLLEGGIGADTFRFVTTAERATASPDTITDLETGIDRIDLSRIDAMAATVGDQTFTFIGSAAFAAEGQVRAVSFGAHFQVEVNTAGSCGAGMMVILGGVTALTGGDFIL